MTDLHTCAMCPPPAGAPIVIPCAPNVLIGNLPAARMTDICVCVPPPPMGGDAIITGAFTVLINGLPAARMTDLTVKGGVVITGCPNVLIGMLGFGMPSFALSLFDLFVQKLKAFVKMVFEVLKKVAKATMKVADFAVDTVASVLSAAHDWFFQEHDWYFGNDTIKFLHLKWEPKYIWDDDEISVLGKIEFTGLEVSGDSGAEEFELFGIPFGFRGESKFLTARAEGEQGVGFADGTMIPTGIHGELKDTHAKGAAGKYEVYTGTDPNNPEHALGLELAVLNAGVASDMTVGEGGRDTGLGGYGKASADVVDGALTWESNQDHGDGTSTSERFKVGIAGGAVGGSAGAWGEQDQDTGRTHGGGELGVKLALGGSISGDVSHGPKYTSTGGRKF